MEQRFSNQFQHTLDEKGRLTLPSKFRAALATGVVVTRGLDGCLFAFPQEEWDLLSAKLSALSVGDEASRQVARFFFAGANEGVPDKQGRILLPTHLRDFAELRTDVIVAGVGNRLEIWDAQKWQDAMTQTESNIARNSQALAVAKLF